MRRVSPSVLAREELDRLLHGGADAGTNIVSLLVETITRLVVQELLEGEQADFLGGRGPSSGGKDARGCATATRRAASAPPRGPWRCAYPRCGAPRCPTDRR
jgi:hypothetical protein